MPKTVLAAPRVDYLVESVAKRQDRERRVADALEVQRRKRLHMAERLSHSPSAALSPSSAMYGSSSSNSPHGQGGQGRSPSTGMSDAYSGQMETTPATPFDILDLFQLGGDFMFPDLASDHDPAMVSEFLTKWPSADLVESSDGGSTLTNPVSSHITHPSLCKQTLFLSNPQQQQHQQQGPSSQPYPRPYPTGQPSNFYAGGGSSWNSGGLPNSGMR